MAKILTEQDRLSMQHFQRNQLAVVNFTLERGTRYPCRVTVLPSTSSLTPNKKIMPLDLFVDFGHPYRDSTFLKFENSQGLSDVMFFKVFDRWIKSCGLGVSSNGSERAFLPLFTSVEQYVLAREIWGASLLDWTLPTVRLMDSVIAYENDIRAKAGYLAKFGKNTWRQAAAKCGNEVPRSVEGAQLCLYILDTYKRLVCEYQRKCFLP